MRHFLNPVLPGMHPDPSICRVGRDFYLVTSSFEYFPGVPIFHSRDLVHWEQLGHVLSRPSQLKLRAVRSSGGIYAPTIRHSAGRFYVITTHVDGGGNFLVHAARPEGPWSDPVWIDRQGIDPSLLFADGRVYYTRNGPGADPDHPLIYQTVIDPLTGKLAGPPKPIWRGLGGIWPESPHLYKLGRWYYLLTAEGGTGYDHSLVIARSRSPEGPFEDCPRNPVLTHRDRPAAAIGATGHADLVATSDGRWWAVMLGVRPNIRRDERGAVVARYHHLGRETFLAPVTWDAAGWPVVGNRGRIGLRMRAPRLAAVANQRAGTRRRLTGERLGRDPFARDDFDTSGLSPHWNFLRNPHGRDWSLTERPGFLRLRGSAVTLDDVASPALVVRRQKHLQVRCRTSLHFLPRAPREEAGLVIRATENFHYDLVVSGMEGGGIGHREVVLRARVAGVSREIARANVGGVGAVLLEVAATRHRYTFRFGLDAPGGARRLRRLGELSTEDLASEKIWASGCNYFTGAFLGLFASGNGRRSSAPADFDWFDYVPAAPPSLAPSRRVRNSRGRPADKVI